MQSTFYIHWAEANINGKLAAILAPTHQVETYTHWAYAGSVCVGAPMGGVCRAQAFRQEQFQGLASQFGLCIPEQVRGLVIDQNNGTIDIHHEEGIRREVQKFHGLG